VADIRGEKKVDPLNSETMELRRKGRASTTLVIPRVGGGGGKQKKLGANTTVKIALNQGGSKKWL